MLLSLCYLRNKILPSSGSKKTYKECSKELRSLVFARHLKTVDEFIRSDIKALPLHFFFPQQVHGAVYICNMFGDFYPFGRSVIGRRNFKKSFTIISMVISSIYSEKMNIISPLFQF